MRAVESALVAAAALAVAFSVGMVTAFPLQWFNDAARLLGGAW